MDSTTRRRIRYSAVGACVGVTMYNKLDSKRENIQHSSRVVLQVARLVVHSIFSTTEVKLTKFQTANLGLLCLLVVTNCVKRAIFGKLSNGEVKVLREKITYTVWEFCLSSMIFYIMLPDMANITETIDNMMYKFAGLFLCVLLIKCFHYLAMQRVQTVFRSTHHKDHIRFGLGLVLLTGIDISLIFKFFSEITYGRKLQVIPIKSNILVTMFGFEILHIFPCILLTCYEFGVNYYEYLFARKQDDVKWTEKKLKLGYIVEFLVNLARFCMLCLFAIIFLYFYTFPLHILPSSYLSLKVLVLKARCLLNFQKTQLQLKKLKIVDGSSSIVNGETCTICFDDLKILQLRQLDHCPHIFHYNCLKRWVKYSKSCPICRKEL